MLSLFGTATGCRMFAQGNSGGGRTITANEGHLYLAGDEHPDRNFRVFSAFGGRFFILFEGGKGGG